MARKIKGLGSTGSRRTAAVLGPALALGVVVAGPASAQAHDTARASQTRRSVETAGRAGAPAGSGFAGPAHGAWNGATAIDRSGNGATGIVVSDPSEWGPTS
ncbi:hypothetical protein [Actinoallomurus rhizosphaericola]|uniref:hypothetical protein n=1 Tax=Actinoallomurus rhizosphaericola TaxID=2952536 RepID=UPI002091EEC4|nr:hypothetical protein [Actinoallomurus rhizosphaericola]MCO5998572.1 hypothetical protein [Actinoallomurus rhizosphaericola]